MQTRLRRTDHRTDGEDAFQKAGFQTKDPDAFLMRAGVAYHVTIAEVGYRYDELVAAAKSRNWDYAQHPTEKIAHTIRLGLERRPKRAKSTMPFRVAIWEFQ